MTTNTVDKQAVALQRLLERLETLHRELHEVIRRKVDRMRASDIDGMRAAIDREADLVARVTEEEGLRRQMMTSIGQLLDIAPSRARAMNVRDLAARLPAARREPLLDAAGRLRKAVAAVARSNRVAGLIAREILAHFRHVFAAMTTTDGGTSGGYTHKGGRNWSSQRQLLDAVG